MKITRILLILIMGFSVVFALNVPKASKYDAKITFATYNANDVFEICSYVDLFLKLLISSLLPLFIVEHCHYSLKWQLER